MCKKDEADWEWLSIPYMVEENVNIKLYKTSYEHVCSNRDGCRIVCSRKCLLRLAEAMLASERQSENSISPQ